VGKSVVRTVTKVPEEKNNVAHVKALCRLAKWEDKSAK
jgi:hypothetical protein